MDKRTCIKCEMEYPLTDKYFALVHGSETRRLTICRECRKEYDRQYRLNKKQETTGEDMYTIKEEPIESQKHRMLKAFNYIHIQAYGEPMTQMIYWCKTDDCVQIDIQECGACNKPMEKIGFVEYSEDDK